MKKLITIITLTAAMAASSLSTIAAANVTDDSSTSIKNSYVDTVVSDKTGIINIGDCKTLKNNFLQISHF